MTFTHTKRNDQFLTKENIWFHNQLFTSWKTNSNYGNEMQDMTFRGLWADYVGHTNLYPTKNII